MLKVTNRISRPVQVEGIIVPVKGTRTINTKKTDRIRDLVRAGIISVVNIPTQEQIITKKRAQQPAPIIISSKKNNKSQGDKPENSDAKQPEDNKN